MEEFRSKGIEVPGPLKKDFENVLDRKRRKRNEEYLSSLTSWKN